MEAASVIEAELQEVVVRLVDEIEAGRLRSLERLAGGGNNRVYRLEADAGPLLFKHYHFDPEDGRDRAAAEFEFSAFAWSGGVRCIPQPLVFDPIFHMALFEWIDGTPLEPEPVGATEVDAALAFFTELNRLRSTPGASVLRFASEACFTAEDHLGTVASRVRRLRTIEPAGVVEREAIAFVTEELMPCWERLEDRTAEALATFDDGGEILRGEQRCLSPSDFGFHNARRRADGSLVFHDFEYAGWDDPAKTICDFFCQPQIPVPLGHWERFAAGIAGAVGTDAPLAERARQLLHVYRIKWCCIVLNEFLPAAAERRRFAGGRSVDDVVLRRQLGTARRLLSLVAGDPA